MQNDDERVPKLAAPARRALSAAGYTRLDQLAEVSEADLKKLHGMGPTAITALREALHARGLSFHRGAPASGHLEEWRGPPTKLTSTCVVSRSPAAARFRRSAARSLRSSRTPTK